MYNFSVHPYFSFSKLLVLDRFRLTHSHSCLPEYASKGCIPHGKEDKTVPVPYHNSFEVYRGCGYETYSYLYIERRGG
jgi:hypothetical protein